MRQMNHVKKLLPQDLVTDYCASNVEIRKNKINACDDTLNSKDMPLIILTGAPASGKTTRANELKVHFENASKEVHMVSEHEQIIKAGFEKNLVYQDSAKEKHIRSLLKSEVIKLLRPNNVVILDGLNYIKGYRYELYCGSKANRSTQCTVLTQINHEEAWNLNVSRENVEERYDRKTFDALLMRYEEPDKKNRWDSPLFVSFPNDGLELEEITGCLFGKKPPPPNMATQNPPLSSTNFLHDLNRIIKEVTDKIIKLINSGVKGDVNIPGYTGLSIDVSDVTVQKVVILSRQYITYSKMHAPDIKQVPQLYIQYLKSNLNS